MHLSKKLVLLFICYFSCMAVAVANQTIQLPKYYQATCTSYTGTWQGFFSDPTDLFGNGGPWPVTISLYNKDSAVVGEVNDSKAPVYVIKAMQGAIWAQCKDGQLANIFLGDPKQCGSYSQTGLLVSKNVLIMQINYEKAMNGTTFLVVLNRVNNQYSGKIPSVMQLESLKSCH